MAFGTSRIQRGDPVCNDILWRHHVDRERVTDKGWEKKWHWMLDEYEQLYAKCQGISNKSKFLAEINKKFREDDMRSARPVPDTTNHFYGWLGAKSDFKLDIYGPDVDRGLPLPKDYLIFKDYE